MPFLCISVSFLDNFFNGFANDEPEWPPSPLRLFQALLNGICNGRSAFKAVEPMADALRWLERLPAPDIFAPAVATTTGYTFFVPNNDSDHAKKFERHERLSAKVVRPTRLLDGVAVHYLWEMGPTAHPFADSICAAANRLLALGWGIDMAFARGSILSSNEVDALRGERWLVADEHGDSTRLSVPMAGTLANLIDRHERFLVRLGREGMSRKPRLCAYRTVIYRRSFDPAPRPSVSFALRDPDRDTMRPFDPVRHTLTVAQMTRRALKSTATNSWPASEIARLVMGHGEPHDAEHEPVPSRLGFLPLPSLEYRGPGKPRVVGSVRRVMLSSFGGSLPDKINRARNYLPGQELLDPHRDHAAVALLSPPTPKSDPVTRCYLDCAASWATVTPVVLPGYDDPDHYRRRLRRGVNAAEQRELLDRLSARIEGLLRKAIIQAGFSKQLAERADLAWRSTGFFSGVELAGRYEVPDYLKPFPRLHVRLTWRDPSGHPFKVAGPICLGGGRFFGLGLFASDRDA